MSASGVHAALMNVGRETCEAGSGAATDATEFGHFGREHGCIALSNAWNGFTDIAPSITLYQSAKSLTLLLPCDSLDAAAVIPSSQAR